MSGFAPAGVCAAPRFHNPNPAPQFCTACDFCSRKERPSSPLLQGLLQRRSAEFRGKPSAVLAAPARTRQCHQRHPSIHPRSRPRLMAEPRAPPGTQPARRGAGGAARRPRGRRRPRPAHCRQRRRDAPGAGRPSPR